MVMMMHSTIDVTKLKEAILEALEQDDRLWDEDKTTLNQTLLLDLVEGIDEAIISLLFSNNVLQDKFFVTIAGATVFKSKDFRFFMEENKVDNSYTQYRNRIGLSDGERFLKDSRDVVLNFPYKDCVLEGGQTKEDTVRKEIFFNEVLAQDEIDRLLDKKAFINWKRHDASGGQAVGEIKRDDSGTIRENMIIKGNNLLALHSLKEQFTGKVKLIYIDPPYNTDNDSFRYNDKFTHSTWLTFMKNRLEIAKQLLRDDGAIFVQCDNNEHAYLKILMDEVFGRENFQREIVWRIGWLSGFKTKANNFIRNHDTILYYSKNSKEVFFKKVYIQKKDFVPRFNKASVEEISDFLEKKGWSGKEIKEFFLIAKEAGLPDKYTLEDTWNCSIYDRLNSIAVTSFSGESVSKMLGTEELKGQKSESLIERIIESSTESGEIVLDFFVGSGTTAAVAHKMGRQYIGIEQHDYIEELTVPRLKKVIEGEQSGISKSVEWDSGGDFLYFELAKWNEQAKEEIEACKDLNTLIKLFDKLCSKYFLHYNFKIKDFKEKRITEEEFKSLSLDDQKQLFHAMLDLNQMYVCRSEMTDNRFNISAEDQKLTSEFYDD